MSPIPRPHMCEEPGCQFASKTPAGLRAHIRIKHEDAQGPPPPRPAAAATRARGPGAGPSAATDAAIRQEADRTVSNLVKLSLLLMAFAPHTAILIQRRADGIGRVTADGMRRDERILRGVRGFNDMMDAGEAVELAGQAAATIAVDLGAVDPELEIQLGPVPFQPVRLFIGDIIDEVALIEQAREMEMADGAGARPATNGAGRIDKRHPIPGGVTNT